MTRLTSTPRYWTETDEIDGELQVAILRLLGSREVGDTVSLMEAALAVGGESWRALLERALAAAVGLAEAGLIEFVDEGGFGVGGKRKASLVRLKLRAPVQLLAPGRLN